MLALPDRCPCRMKNFIVIGGGPAGLMGAEVLSAAGHRVTVFERMPSVGRKLLIAGRGGLNLTHSEPIERFAARYGSQRQWLQPMIEAFPPSALIAWAEGLGQATFVGSSGRVFPKALKASPLLRAWLKRLADQGVEIRTRHEWLGWSEGGDWRFHADGRDFSVKADAALLALGGASWPRLGANGAWMGLLTEAGVGVAPFSPANCGVNIPWTEHFRSRFEGAPLQGASFAFGGVVVRGEAVVTRYGVEGGPVYALSAALRDAIARDGSVELSIDLRPEMNVGVLAAKLGKARAGETLANFLRKTVSLAPVGVNLLREAFGGGIATEPVALARQIKSVGLKVTGTQGLERAISSAGGILASEVDGRMMLKKLPGVHVAGEMLDWEAPTGGYLLQACFASGVAAAGGMLGKV